jgi:transposase
MLYCRCGSFPEHALRQNSALQPFIDELCSLWQTGCRNAMQAWREITKSGYMGSRHSVARWFRARRTEPSASTPKRYLTPAFALVTSQRHLHYSAPMFTGADTALDYSPRQLSWLMLRSTGKLSPGDSDLLERVKQLPAVRSVFEAAQGFVEMVRQHDPERLRDWLSDCEATNVAALVTFAKGIQKDKDSIIAALSMHWSNGQTEGQVTRLKLIKRQMYGRANLDLLKIRFLGRL